MLIFNKMNQEKIKNNKILTRSFGKKIINIMAYYIKNIWGKSIKIISNF